MHNDYLDPDKHMQNDAASDTNVNTAELYLAICCEPYGTQIFIDGAGEIHTADASLSHRGLPEDWLYFGKADGDFERSGWGIQYNEEAGGFTVANLQGVFGTDNEALRAAVESFGLDAETHDILLAEIEARQQEENL